MLDKYELFRAVGEADGKDIEDAAEFFGYTGKTKSRSIRKFSRTLLIAAIIVSLLAVTASAIGVSAHIKKQQELREQFQIEENNVGSYKEYPADKLETGEKTVTVLSCLNERDYMNVYLDLSPVEEDELKKFFFPVKKAGVKSIHSFGAEAVDENGEAVDLVSVDYLFTEDTVYSHNDYENSEDTIDGKVYKDRKLKPEAKMREAMRQAYDKESKTLSLTAMFFVGYTGEKLPEEIKFKLVDYTNFYNGNTGAFLYGEKGAEMPEVIIEPAPYENMKLYFPEPIVIKDEESGIELQYIGMEISATRAIWLMRSNVSDRVYYGVRDDEWWEIQENYQQLRLAAEDSTKVNFDDGTSVTPISEYGDYIDGVLYSGGDFQKTVNIDNIVSITVNEVTFPVSECRDKPE